LKYIVSDISDIK